MGFALRAQAHRVMVRLSIKKIKEELEGKKTLDDKCTYLEEILKKLKGKKSRAAIEELLEEVKKHLEHEERFTEDKLEKKLVTSIPVTEIEAPERIFGEVKYVSRQKMQPIRSELEREIRTTPIATTRAVEIGPPKYITIAGGRYIGFGNAAEQARLLLEERGVIRGVTEKEFQYMDPLAKKMLFETVSTAAGGIESYDQLNQLVKYVAVKPEEKKGKKGEVEIRYERSPMI